MPGKSYSWAAGVVENVDRFDASFFGISPREAEQIDPQQRLLLELAWEAIEDSGLLAAKLAGTETGVYVGASSMDYAFARTGDPAAGNAYFMTGTSLSIFSNRLSYVLDFRGPSLTVDTACSSSMVALDLACKSLRSGRVPLALVAGVNLLLSPYPYLGFCQASMLSRRGRCFAFDERADGYVRAEGGGAILLKPLSAALADGDKVRALVVGSGINQDGRTMGLSLPNRDAQAALLRAVYSQSGVSAQALSFIEAHGTGTPAGDPIEASALGEVLGRNRTSPLLMGSVKSNLGHLEPASGMAGLIKTMLALEHRLLPPSINCASPNPQIAFEALNLEVAREICSLPAQDVLYAGVNSFGFGGTNAHAILASAPPRSDPLSITADVSLPLLLSARSDTALRVLAGKWSDILANKTAETAAPLLRAAARRRDQHPHRLAMTATAATFAERLRLFKGGEPAADIETGSATAKGTLAFVFSGNGAQWRGMAHDALRYSRQFRAAAEEVDAIIAPALGWSVIDHLSADLPEDVFSRTDVAQPLLFAVQVGIVAALRAQGVEPSACIGHSVGEIAAAWAVGSLTLADAGKIVVERSRHQELTRGRGRMAALGLAVDEAARAIGGIPNLEIAAVNSHSGVTIVGAPAALEKLRAKAEKAGWYYAALDLDYPFHSAAMDPIRDDLIASLHGIAPRSCEERFVSSVTGGVLSGTRLTAEYWWRNIREPVQFSAAVDALIEADARIFVEIGPHPILLSYIRGQLRHAEKEGRVLATLGHQGSDSDPFPKLAASYFVAGCDITGAAAFSGDTAARGLPLYPWQRDHHWFAGTGEEVLVTAPLDDHPLLGFRRARDESRWSNLLDTRTMPWLADHGIEGHAVFPAAAFLEIAAAVARVRYGVGKVIELTDFEIPRALPLDSEARELRVEAYPDGRIEISSRARLTGEVFSLHCLGRIAAIDTTMPVTPESSSPRRIFEAAEIYATAARLGLDYGPCFRTLTRVDVTGARDAWVYFRDMEDAAPGYIVHPTHLDGALQGFLPLLADRIDPELGMSLLPIRFGRICLFPPFGRVPARAALSLQRIGNRTASGAFTLVDRDGNAIVQASDCWFRQVGLRRRVDPARDSYHFLLTAAPRKGDLPTTEIDLAACVAAVGDRVPSHSETALLLDAYVASAAFDGIARLISAAEFSIAGLSDSGTLASGAAPLFESMMELLTRHAAAYEKESGFELAVESGLPPAADIWRTLLVDAPAMTAELALAGAAAAALVDTLRTGSGPAPAPDLLEQFLYASPSGERAVEALCDAILAFVQRWPRERPINVVELGSRSGVLTRRLLELLSTSASTWTYIATDPDRNEVARLQNAIVKWSSATAVCWDDDARKLILERDGIDLVVSVFGLSRSMRGYSDWEALRQLAPGATLLALEPEPNAVWDLIFGQQQSWWNDVGIAGGKSPLRAVEEWKIALLGAGFKEPQSRRIASASWPCQFIAARMAPKEKTSAERRSIPFVIVIAGISDPIGLRLIVKFTASGTRARLIDPPAAADGAQLLALLAEAKDAEPEIVLLPSATAAPFDSVSRASARLASVLTVTKLVTGACERARLWLVTRDAQQKSPAANGAGAQEAALWGLGRCIANELPQLDCRFVDFANEIDAEQMAARIAEEMQWLDEDREIVWTEVGRNVLRLKGGLPPRVQSDNIALAIARPGLIDSLQWRDALAPEPGQGQVAIEVAAAGLNFRDVMWALDLLPEEAVLDGFAGAALGLECAGIVTAVGPEVEGLAVGDRVAGFAPSSLASRVVTASKAVVPIPDDMEFAAAATVPVAFLTVAYALGTLARLKAGEWVLIHGGAGGVGLAAIHYARNRGARIIATAGSETKRTYLRLIGVDHVLDSRTTAFVDAVMELTGGEGVDVVLNSLGGEAMERSLGLVKPFGRFLELGKRDFYLNTRIGLRPLRQNVSYFAIDADQLPRKRPDLAHDLLLEIVDLIKQGALSPLPRRTFSYSDAPASFRLMQGSGHIGKIVLVPDAERVAERSRFGQFAIHPDATYLVSGGLSGFGLAAAQWLAEHGARHLALLGRRGAATPGADAALAGFALTGAEARAYACDVADERAVAAVLKDIRAGMPPLRGIVHAAMVLDDALLSDLTRERIERVMAPKLGGGDILDRLTREDAIDLFLFFSSATTFLGAPGQASYVAANAALEGLARRRRAAGKPALAVAWGPIADTGYLAENGKTSETLARRLAATPISAKEALNTLPALWASGFDTVALASVNWQAARRHLKVLNFPTYADFNAATTELDGADLRERLEGLEPEEAGTLVVSVLTEEIGRILQLAGDRVDAHRALSELGMDSLMAVELRLVLESRLGIGLPLLSLSDSTSIVSLSALVVRSIRANKLNRGLETIVRHETTDEVVRQATRDETDAADFRIRRPAAE